MALGRGRGETFEEALLNEWDHGYYSKIFWFLSPMSFCLFCMPVRPKAPDRCQHTTPTRAMDANRLSRQAPTWWVKTLMVADRQDDVRGFFVKEERSWLNHWEVEGVHPLSCSWLWLLLLVQWLPWTLQNWYLQYFKLIHCQIMAKPDIFDENSNKC